MEEYEAMIMGGKGGNSGFSRGGIAAVGYGEEGL